MKGYRVMSLEEFKKYRDTNIAKEINKKTGENIKGYFLFNNQVAEAIFEKRPKAAKDLESIKGIPKGGKHWNIVSREIIKYFQGSKMFT